MRQGGCHLVDMGGCRLLEHIQQLFESRAQQLRAALLMHPRQQRKGVADLGRCALLRKVFTDLLQTYA